jgi:hypothetical protein
MHLNTVKQIHQSLLMNDNSHAIDMRVSLTFDDINGIDDNIQKSNHFLFISPFFNNDGDIWMTLC